MTRTHKILGFVLVTLFGVYGCAKGSTGGTGRDTSPAAKAQRLEEELRAAAAAREEFRQKMLAAEEAQAKLQKQFDQEREALRAELKARTAERDNFALQYEGFRKSLRDLLGQAESALANPGSPSPPAPAVVGSQGVPVNAGAALRN